MTHSFGSTEVWGNFLNCGIFFEEINSFLTKELFFFIYGLVCISRWTMVSPFSLSAPVFCFFTTEVNFYLNEPPPPTVDSQWGSYSGEREREVLHSHLHALHRQERPLHTSTAHTRWFLNWSTKKKQKSDFGSSDVKLFFIIAKFEVMLCTTNASLPFSSHRDPRHAKPWCM